MPTQDFRREHYTDGMHFRGTVYTETSLPSDSDPGWGVYRHRATGTKVRMIQIHGPFLLHTLLGEQECHAGWLGFSDDGPFVVSDENQPKDYELLNRTP